MADSAVLAAEYESKTETEAEDLGGPSFVKMWLDAIKRADAEEKDWRKTADDANKLFRGGTGSRGKNFNIFHSNVETICPALYNSTPIPDVRRRFLDADKLGKEVANIIERALSFSVDSYDFDAVMKAVIKDGELPGRGIARVRYVPYRLPAKDEAGQPVLDEKGQPQQEVAYEEAPCEYVPWKLFKRGPARLWGDLTWVAFGAYLTKEELAKVNPKLVEEVPLNHTDAETQSDKKGKEEQSIFRRALVWQIWDKDTRRLISICPDFEAQALEIIDDPLGLTDFFPIPRAYQPILCTDSLTPVVPYSIYEDLVTELNDITRRIAKLIKQIRPRGGYAGNAGDIKAIADADDGELVALGNIEAVLSGLDLNKLISWFPLEPTAKALQALVEQRERVKQTIYEVTGIADILRGATDPNETLGAQQIKAQWGSLRIQDRQAEVQRVARDLFRLKAEIIATRFSPQTLQLMTGIEITPEIEQLLRNDVMRAYRIDIESDSTIRGDLSRNQEAMNGFLQGTAQFAQSMGPIIMQFPPMLEPAMEVFSAFARNFKLGRQAETALEGLSEATRGGKLQQQQDKPDPKAEMEKQKLALQAQKDQIDAQLAKEKNAIEREKLQDDRERIMRELALKEREIALKEEAGRADLQFRERDTSFKEESGRKDIALRTAGQNKQLVDEQNAEAAGGEAPQADSPLTVMAQMAAQMGQVMQAIAQGQQQQSEMMAALIGQMNAPKQLDVQRDALGKIVGATQTPMVQGI